MPTGNAAVEAALARRAEAAPGTAAMDEWFITEVENRVGLELKQRVQIATEWVRTKVVQNISKAVVKITGPRGGTIVTQRSARGEFPRADTTQLMKTIFTTFEQDGRGVYDGFVGSPLSYSIELELDMNRKHLSRTLGEELRPIERILGGKIVV